MMIKETPNRESILKIVICGGGGLGHTCAGVLSNHENVTVDILTNRPALWNKTFRINTPDGQNITGRIGTASASPEELIPHADIVLFCLPAYLVEESVIRIKPYLRHETIVGTVFGSTGFFLFAHKHLHQDAKLFAFQRVPYISRVVEYGKEANLLGFRDELIMAAENIDDVKAFSSLIESLFRESVVLCDSFYEVTLSNSNPILHTGRLYTMWKDWDGTPCEKCGLFYQEWTQEASQLEIEMDKEFFKLLEALQIKTTFIDTLLSHYESEDAASMTAKIQSIKSLSTILSPMKKVNGGWVPDFKSRYFTEDFPYGLRVIHDLAHEHAVSCPHIDMVYEWGQSIISKSE